MEKVNKMENKMSISIPFSGFYESVHSGLIDHEIEQLFADRDTGEEGVIPEAFYLTDYCTKATFEAYAKDYLENFRTWLYLEINLDISLEFEKLYRPRFYNYQTDRIFAFISLEDARKLEVLANPLTLKAVIERRHTSRSGFISFYSNDLATWKSKNLAEYDCNELETVLIAAIETAGNDNIEVLLDDHALMEPSTCNGVISSIVWDNMGKGAREIVDAQEKGE